MNNCPNCGSNVNLGEAFCRVCGTKMPVPQNNLSNNTQQPQQVNNVNTGFQQSQQMNNQNVNFQQQNMNSTLQGFQQPQNNGYVNNGMPQNNYINNEDLIDSYIGKNADKLKNGGFSVNTFFFGSLYVLYRKMWLLGFIWLAVNMIANMFLESIASVITIAANIIISMQFKKFYLKHVEEQVDKIKAENPGKTKEQLMMICSQKGGTTLVPVIIAIIFYGIVFFIAFTVVFDILDEARENAQNSQYDYNNTSTNITNGTGTIGNLNVTIPSNLVVSKYSTDDHKTYRTDYNNNDSCSLKLSTTKSSYYNNDAKQYLEKSIYYSATDTFSGISQKTVNNNSWYYATVTTSYNQEYYYSILNNGTIYEIEFEISEDDNKTCSSAYNTVINSLKFN